ncbi:glutathione S-transferase family protein [Enterovirga aerilata]|uniref:Glutathione S-transferase family protein n=1 Tax=Enterovirga aerilata TaxID=2730920 RepID=A0A849I3V5_9HYPH|nr:glutathione S-transferase family protein [Enterovirga sp. DB1703]NNM71069.1 glutathione S-transferase family protein [Enterovirga sp. DB1703]
MAVLHHYPFCPHSRFIRLSLAEMGIQSATAEERPWERDESFLRLNPSGTTPVLCDDEIAVPGANVIAEYLDETRGPGLNGRRLLPPDPATRVEVRRLVEWFNGKFFEEVTSYLLEEKILKRFRRGASPDASAIRAARSNMRYHLRYIGYLAGTRNWLAGDRLTYADLAAAAHLSCADYLGDVPWDEDETARDWYARVKSRPAFRPILVDRIPGMAPAAHYADLDF